MSTADPRRVMLSSARARAKKSGIPCTIALDDIVIPTHCPVLGLRFKRGRGRGGALPTSPTIDKIVPELGYVPGNIVVISHRANSLKSDATAAELTALARYFAPFT